MHIVIFDGSFKTTAFIRRLLQGLVNAGHKVFVLGFNEANPQAVAGVSYIKLGNNQSKINFLKTSFKWAITSKHLLKQFSLLLKGNKAEMKQLNLKAALDHIQPDLIHLQWVSNIKLFEECLKEKKYKFILSQRGYQTNVRPFVNAENFNYLQKWLPKFSGFHSVSKAISKVGDEIHSSAHKIDQVVYTGLDLSKFEFQSQIIENEVLQIISVGRPHWIKGYDVALQAVKTLKESGVHFHYQIIGGKGDEELLFLINALNLSPQVELLGQMPQEEVFKLMQSADVFLLPSLEEGIANVAVEAMALGTPVISTDCGGMQELITHNKEGWVVPTRDSEAMAQQIIKFSKLPKKQVLDIKSAARQKVEIQHSEAQMVEGMLGLYSKVGK